MPATRVLRGFQSRSGFSPRRDPPFARCTTTQTTVSIPQWVFSPSRPDHDDLVAAVNRLFQSRSGFSPRRDRIENDAEAFLQLFQSRSGFSPRRDSKTRSQRSCTVTVSIPQWVFSPSRRQRSSPVSSRTLLFQSRSGFSPRRDRRRGCRRRHRLVSIPQWVFSPSRLNKTVVGVNAILFQSRSGFSPRRDPLDVVVVQLCSPFQSRSGFSPRRDPPAGVEPAVLRVFQSRSGFSPRRDSGRLCDGHIRAMFQSRSGFSPRRDRSVDRLDPETALFQSRSGFSPRRDGRWLRALRSACRGFNPAVGFLPVATRRGRGAPYGRSVSIPQWVFSPSRRPITIGPSDFELFQSRSGFSPRRDVSTTLRCGPRRQRFNPAVGFLPVATTHHDRSIRLRVVSIPQWVFSPSRRVDDSSVWATPTAFQSRSGFSPRRDVACASTAPLDSRFQSRSGFSPRRDRGVISPHTTYSLPSIGESRTRLRHPPLYTDFIKGHVDRPRPVVVHPTRTAWDRI